METKYIQDGVRLTEKLHNKEDLVDDILCLHVNPEEVTSTSRFMFRILVLCYQTSTAFDEKDFSKDPMEVDWNDVVKNTTDKNFRDWVTAFLMRGKHQTGDKRTVRANRARVFLNFAPHHYARLYVNHPALAYTMLRLQLALSDDVS